MFSRKSGLPLGAKTIAQSLGAKKAEEASIPVQTHMGRMVVGFLKEKPKTK